MGGASCLGRKFAPPPFQCRKLYSFRQTRIAPSWRVRDVISIPCLLAQFRALPTAFLTSHNLGWNLKLSPTFNAVINSNSYESLVLGIGIFFSMIGVLLLVCSFLDFFLGMMIFLMHWLTVYINLIDYRGGMSTTFNAYLKSL